MAGAAVTINATVGNAVAAGQTAAIELARIIDAIVGDATASGITSAVSFNSIINATVANAIAAGVSATISTSATLTDSQKIDLILKILSDKQTLDASIGLYTLYDTDGTTVLYTAAAWEDVTGTQPYRGQGLARLDAMQ